jgi:hypothetical protein
MTLASRFINAGLGAALGTLVYEFAAYLLTFAESNLASKLAFMLVFTTGYAVTHASAHKDIQVTLKSCLVCGVKNTICIVCLFVIAGLCLAGGHAIQITFSAASLVALPAVALLTGAGAYVISRLQMHMRSGAEN